MNSQPPTHHRRGIYLLPNLFTTAALFSGFYAGTAAINGRYELAAIVIFVAMVLDGLDGRLARLTRQTSALGEQLDSMSDMVTFGVAPAYLAVAGGRVGWTPGSYTNEPLRQRPRDMRRFRGRRYDRTA